MRKEPGNFMKPQRPRRELSPVEEDLYQFLKLWNKWLDAYYVEREKRFGDDGDAARAAMLEFDREYRKKHPKPERPRAMDLDLNGCLPGNINSKLRDGYYIKDHVISFHEKHGDRHFLLPANDIEAHGRVALRVIRDRNSGGFQWYSTEPPEEPGRPEVMTEEQISALPEKFRDIARDDIKKYKAAMRYYEDESLYVKRVKQALGGDAVAAVQLLISRQNGEYEGYTIFEPERV